MTATQVLRPELASLPKNMEGLRIYRGYPVPWFVDWIDENTPEFRSMDGRKWVRARQERLCWVCGNKLPAAANFVFVVGPMCGINRTTSEPPCHIDCARWSALNCPFLSNPDQVRRQDEVINNEKFREKGAGIPIARNPGVTLLWFTREFEVFDAGGGRPLITMGRPSGVEWYCRGRRATRDEVLESIEGGFPALEAIARSESPTAIGHLYVMRTKFEEKWLPKR